MSNTMKSINLKYNPCIVYHRYFVDAINYSMHAHGKFQLRDDGDEERPVRIVRIARPPRGPSHPGYVPIRLFHTDHTECYLVTIDRYSITGCCSFVTWVDKSNQLPPARLSSCQRVTTRTTMWTTSVVKVPWPVASGDEVTGSPGWIWFSMKLMYLGKDVATRQSVNLSTYRHITCMRCNFETGSCSD